MPQLSLFGKKSHGCLRGKDSSYPPDLDLEEHQVEQDLKTSRPYSFKRKVRAKNIRKSTSSSDSLDSNTQKHSVGIFRRAQVKIPKVNSNDSWGQVELHQSSPIASLQSTPTKLVPWKAGFLNLDSDKTFSPAFYFTESCRGAIMYGLNPPEPLDACHPLALVAINTSAPETQRTFEMSKPSLADDRVRSKSDTSTCVDQIELSEGSYNPSSEKDAQGGYQSLKSLLEKLDASVQYIDARQTGVLKEYRHIMGYTTPVSGKNYKQKIEVHTENQQRLDNERLPRAIQIKAASQVASLSKQIKELHATISSCQSRLSDIHKLEMIAEQAAQLKVSEARSSAPPSRPPPVPPYNNSSSSSIAGRRACLSSVSTDTSNEENAAEPPSACIIPGYMSLYANAISKATPRGGHIDCLTPPMTPVHGSRSPDMHTHASFSSSRSSEQQQKHHRRASWEPTLDHLVAGALWHPCSSKTSSIDGIEGDSLHVGVDSVMLPVVPQIPVRSAARPGPTAVRKVSTKGAWAQPGQQQRQRMKLRLVIPC